MPRPVWSGAISFGLVTIPIKVISATEDHSIAFRQFHIQDGGRIRYRKICELEDEQVSDHEIGKAYEVGRDTLVQVTDEELASMPLPTARAIEISAFVPAGSIDPIQIGDSYYLSAEGVAAKPYTLLRQALERSSKVAVAKFAWHGRERLGLLRVKDDVIVLHAMRWPDEIRSPAELAPPPVELGDSEIDEALELMDAMSDEQLPSDLTDHYREALEQVIEAKAAGKKPPKMEGEAAPAGEVVDLMAALESSVQKAREARGKGEHATVHDMPKKQAAKTTAAAKKSTAKKSPAKKASGRRPRGA